MKINLKLCEKCRCQWFLKKMYDREEDLCGLLTKYEETTTMGGDKIMILIDRGDESKEIPDLCPNRFDYEMLSESKL